MKLLIARMSASPHADTSGAGAGKTSFVLLLLADSTLDVAKELLDTDAVGRVVVEMRTELVAAPLRALARTSMLVGAPAGIVLSIV